MTLETPDLVTVDGLGGRHGIINNRRGGTEYSARFPALGPTLLLYSPVIIILTFHLYMYVRARDRSRGSCTALNPSSIPS